MWYLLAADASMIDQIRGKVDLLGPIVTGENASLVQLILNIFQVAYTLAGVIVVGFIIYGGYQYITSAGNEEEAKQGRSAVTNALIGLIIVLAAVAIHSFVQNAVNYKEPASNSTTNTTDG